MKDEIKKLLEKNNSNKKVVNSSSLINLLISKRLAI